MVGRSRARYLAPLALIAVIAGTYLVVHAGISKKHATANAQSHNRRARRTHHRVAKFYVVKPGQTLTSIADKFGIPVTTLEALNPKVDPNSLQTSQRLRLRR
jgi:LysM repeat protein